MKKNKTNWHDILQILIWIVVAGLISNMKDSMFLELKFIAVVETILIILFMIALKRKRK